MTTFMALCAGLGLAAACGLRVFLPLFVAAIAVRAGFLGVGPHFDWLGSNASIVLFGTATVVEVAGFMIPWVDHALDVVAAPLAAVAGAVLMTSQLLGLTVAAAGAGEAGDAAAAAEPFLHPAVAWSLGIILGATTASGVEAASIAGRLSSSVLTIGWLNPIYGMIETALSLAVTLMAVIVPMVAGMLVLLLLPVLAIAIWRILAWRGKQRRAREAKLQRARERIAYSMSQHMQRTGAVPQGGLAPGPGQPGPG